MSALKTHSLTLELLETLELQTTGRSNMQGPLSWGVTLRSVAVPVAMVVVMLFVAVKDEPAPEIALVPRRRAL